MMKKLIIFVAVIALTGVSFAGIDVGNPSFDEDGVSGSYSYDWSPWQTSQWTWLGNGYYSGAPAGDGWYVITAGATWFQELSATFAAGETISFSIDVGTYSPQPHADGYDSWTMFLYDATVDPGTDGSAAPTSILATATGLLSDEAVPMGVWYNKTVEYTATSANAGHAIGIGFTGDYYTLLDHASVSSESGEVVPAATIPVPADNAPDVQVDTGTLSWHGTTDITSPKYNVWFGTDQTSLNSMATGQTNTNVPVELDYGIRYYWRVDVVDESTNPATVYTGSIWNFTTEAAEVTTLKAGPYVHFYNEGEVTIYYKTSAPVASIVQYGTASSLTQTVTDVSAKTDHELKITGLDPETTYSYRIVMNGLPEATHEFYSAFDAGPGPVPAGPSPYPVDELTDVYTQAAEYIVNTAGIDKGVCIDYGCGTGRLAYEIAKRTNLKIIGYESDPLKIAQAREYLDQAGVYGTRVSVIQISTAELKCRDFTANLVVSDKMIAQGTCPGTSAEVFRVLRPDGGLAILGQPAGTNPALDRTALETWLDGQDSNISETNGLWAVISRGELPGAGKWTHHYADPGNTANSGDTRITNTLQVLWYGNPGPRYIVDRHNRPMSSLYNKGVIITPGVDRLMAYDAYNGTRYWDMSIPQSARVAIFHDCGWTALSDDAVFVAHKDDCARLDLITGQLEATFQAPQLTSGQNRNWGYLAVDGQNLIGSAQKEGASLIGHSRAHVDQAYYSYRPASTSEYMFSIDTLTDTVNWTYKNPTGSAIINPCILVAGDYVYFVESRNSSAYNDADGRVTGATLTSEYLIKLDKTTGQVVDSQPINLPFTQVMYLSYVPSRDLVVATGSYTSGGHVYAHYAYHTSNLDQAWTSTYATGTSANAHGEQDQHPVIVGNWMYNKYYRVDLTTG
ncbi:MAG: class I SAM-dependent methyltransferase, partial [Anaerohalosphaera sp.]|nr:class I SAM-dependent methyltransferase [Anaerohalosphaera sp.]